jgi:UDP-N-acetylmuramate: L-alanyl-gamma-D-glutamyl-meso-diaminopimelate ligase
MGLHNVDNALAAIGAARHAGVLPARACAALGDFAGVRRRMELRGTIAGVKVYDDFAHHPTAIATTIEGLRRRVGLERIIAVLEPRSHTMRVGTHRDTLADSLRGADSVWLYAPPDLGWDAQGSLDSLKGKAHVAHDLEALVAGLSGELHSGDHALLMSNGGFGGLHERLLESLGKRRAP